MKRDFSKWLSEFRESIADYGYYVDFEKVYRNIDGIKVQLNILNSLIGSENIEEELLESLEPAYISGLTLLGGDPFEPENQQALLPFVRKVKKRFADKNIWAYTGYLLDEDLAEGGRKYCTATKELLESIDVLVDGLFVAELKDITLKFKGSSNQRVIDMKTYRENGRIEEIF